MQFFKVKQYLHSNQKEVVKNLYFSLSYQNINILLSIYVFDIDIRVIYVAIVAD